MVSVTSNLMKRMLHVFLTLMFYAVDALTRTAKDMGKHDEGM